MRTMLWIAPNLNHYKARLLNKLGKCNNLDLTVFAGSPVLKQGHRRHEGEEHFIKITIASTKNNFHLHPYVYLGLLKATFQKRYNVLLMPAEKKHLPVIFFLFILKIFFRFKLITYNHPRTRVVKGSSLVEDLMSGFLFSLFDRVIFYTREGMEWMVSQGFIRKDKAFFANNTLDTEEIWRQYHFEVNTSEVKTILFMGRLTPRKRIGTLFKYYRELKDITSKIRLIIIGDGPEAAIAKRAIKEDNSISWQGAIVDEATIANHMRSAHLVFVPGASGLSIVHAFCYGKPYATIAGSHGPEIAYLKNDENGLLLSGNIGEDCKRIAHFLNDFDKYQAACQAAFSKAKELSVENWCSQIMRVISC